MILLFHVDEPLLSLELRWLRSLLSTDEFSLPIILILHTVLPAVFIDHTFVVVLCLAHGPHRLLPPIANIGQLDPVGHLVLRAAWVILGQPPSRSLVVFLFLDDALVHFYAIFGEELLYVHLESAQFLCFGFKQFLLAFCPNLLLILFLRLVYPLIHHFLLLHQLLLHLSFLFLLLLRFQFPQHFRILLLVIILRNIDCGFLLQLLPITHRFQQPGNKETSPEPTTIVVLHHGCDLQVFVLVFPFLDQVLRLYFFELDTFSGQYLSGQRDADIFEMALVSLLVHIYVELHVLETFHGDALGQDHGLFLLEDVSLLGGEDSVYFSVFFILVDYLFHDVQVAVLFA